jgi:hypothetical protein
MSVSSVGSSSAASASLANSAAAFAGLGMTASAPEQGSPPAAPVVTITTGSDASTGPSTYLPPAAAQAQSSSPSETSAFVAISAAIEVDTVTETDMSVTVGGATGGTAPSQAPEDPNSAKALTTLQQVAESQREWIAALRAAYEGKPTPKEQDASANAKGSGARSNAASGSNAASVQMTVTQQTTVETSLSVNAQVDISA